jgi:hypothetical protein
LALRLLPLIGACAAVYGLAAVALGHPEARDFAGRIRLRIRGLR